MPSNSKKLTVDWIATLPAKQELLFFLGLMLFLTMAVLGWVKLPYGFNFIDEGMYMTDGWRMAAGDRLFPDNSTSVVRLYAVFNAAIFKLFPDITLLSFRQLQYFATIFSITIFGFSIYRWSKEYWYIPVVMSVFSFTGLDVVGMSANMSYYTYPHLFLILHISFMLFALKSTGAFARNALLILSGLCLWGIGFSLLPLSATMILPLLLWAVIRGLKINNNFFTIKEALLVVIPGSILWLVLISIYNTDFYNAALDMYHYNDNPRRKVGHLSVDPLALTYIAITAVIPVLLYYIYRLAVTPMVIGAILLSALLFVIIDTNLFGLIHPFWRGWFPAQMWFSAFLIVFIISIILYAVHKRWRSKIFNNNDMLVLITIIPCALYVFLFSTFSDMGALTPLYASIPIIMAISVFLLNALNKKKFRHEISMLLLVALYFPFYYHTAWADWKFTYFDLSPKHLNKTINGGFGSGIKTNAVFYSMAKWIKENSEKYSTAGDFAIMLDRTPMGYMIAKRRPALNHSWTGLTNSLQLRRDSIEIMKQENRLPKIAFRSTRSPLFFPVSLKDERSHIAGRWRFSPDDPISNYVVRNMTLTKKFSVNGDVWIEFYVQKDG